MSDEYPKSLSPEISACRSQPPPPSSRPPSSASHRANWIQQHHLSEEEREERINQIEDLAKPVRNAANLPLRIDFPMNIWDFHIE
ncbi:hypothetical protein Nepgr_020115 [Nepenthes gracilis]|uniref:Uncharacterized protein n=1 Tax=Nepenthes gracilis TaxID=150966 RepID=A0AAD3SX19_NEPGR|nr:hypothetical protein Nepgr_020115 [Nepenthes gracilis]